MLVTIYGYNSYFFLIKCNFNKDMKIVIKRSNIIDSQINNDFGGHGIAFK